MHTNKEFLFNEIKKAKISKPIMIEGMPGMGNVGKLSVDFIIESLKAVKIAEINAHYFNHCVLVKENGICELPRAEVYYKKVGKQDFIIVTGDVQPVDERGCYDFCEELVSYFKNLGGKEIITIGGIGLEDMPKNPRVYVSGNDKDIIKKYKGENANAFNVVGPIIGVSGVIIGVAKLHGIKAVSLLAETFGNPMYLGMKGAKEALRVLEAKLKLGLDIKKVEKDIKDVESEMKERIDKMLVLQGDECESAVQKKHATNYIG